MRSITFSNNIYLKFFFTNYPWFLKCQIIIFSLLFVACQQCTGGMYCPYYNATSPAGPCAPGYYCSYGSDNDKPEKTHKGDAGPCTPGHYCPTNTTTPLLCPRGRYGNLSHLTKAADCTLCEPGFYCGSDGLLNVSGLCDEGFFCLYGSDVKNPSITTLSGGPCPIGHFCPIGTSYPQPCQKGTYTNRTGQSKCEDCCSGYYCIENSTSCILECPEGYYCPKGTGEPFQYPCPAGTYNNSTRKSSINDCVSCDAGKYCPKSGLVNSFDDCEAGWYCRRGALSAKPSDLGNITGSCFCSNQSTGGKCRPGEFCIKGSSEPAPCPPGNFLNVLFQHHLIF